MASRGNFYALLASLLSGDTRRSRPIPQRWWLIFVDYGNEKNQKPAVGLLFMLSKLETMPPIQLFIYMYGIRVLHIMDVSFIDIFLLRCQATGDDLNLDDGAGIDLVLVSPSQVASCRTSDAGPFTRFVSFVASAWSGGRQFV